MTIEQYFNSLENSVLNNPDDILLDNNTLSINYKGLSLSGYLFPFNDLGGVDINYIETSLKFLGKINNMISDQNIYIIEEVKKEFSEFQTKIAGKYKWFKDRKSSYATAFNKKKLSILNEIVDEIYNIMEEVKRKEFRCNTQEYKYIENSVKLISEEFYTNREEKEALFNGEPRKKPKQKKNLHTDEKIIAVAFNKVLHDQKYVSIISNDDAMVDILNISYDLLSCIELDNCLSGIRKRNIRFFNTPKDTCIFAVTSETKNRKLLEKFAFPKKTPGISRHLMERINSELSRAF